VKKRSLRWCEWEGYIDRVCQMQVQRECEREKSNSNRLEKDKRILANEKENERF
jgi:hypothetical protein